MLKDIYMSSIDSEHLVSAKINVPSKCPHCGVAVNPTILLSKYITLKDSSIESDYRYRIFVVFLCNHCLKSFSSEYSFNHYISRVKDYNLTPNATYPVFHSKPAHSDAIKELSERFVNIYDQSHFAEESNLNEICGMGYRKALEFLIKDYAIKLHPEDEEKIKKTQLAPCINTYIDNERIKSLAIASAWLGNDQTHYCRKHEDYSIDSLKSFINAAESFINSEMEAIKAGELIKSKSC